jgi:hypothetical protein
VGNVISLAEKLEKWITVFETDSKEIIVNASSNGRLSFQFNGEIHKVKLSTVESVRFLSEISKGMEEALNCLYEKNE